MDEVEGLGRDGQTDPDRDDRYPVADSTAMERERAVDRR
jgi:hypothetical protein